MEKIIVLLMVVVLVMIGYYIGIQVGEKRYLGEARNAYSLPEHAIYRVLWQGDSRYQALVKDPQGKILFVSSEGAKFPHDPNTITFVNKKMYAVSNDKNDIIPLG